ncbi:MAG: DUF6510 family protein [Sphaerobacter sp.]|nr:DUF6510 family protein [Sphaerobacter sp.]
MDAEALRLDGNAAAGLLDQIFASEVTTVRGTCAGCGRTSSIGALLLYGGAMGAVLRCPGCEAVVLRAAAIRGRYLLDLRGAAHLELRDGA